VTGVPGRIFDAVERVKSWQPGDRPNQVVRARPASKFDPVPRPGDVAQTGALHAQMGGQVTAVRDLIERGDDGPIHELLRGGELAAANL
jgi:hypothetical protein